MRLTLRPVREADAALLLAWRNDPETRANSRRQHPLTWAELTVAPPGAHREIFVAEEDGIPIGQATHDYRQDDCELSWTVAPEHRGRGVGTAIVAAAVAAARARLLIAVIKPDNAASARIAERIGFTPVAERDGLSVWRLSKDG